MPKLGQLACTIEYANTKIPFKEYMTNYGDGWVETYIPVPDHPQEFAINLKSHGFIAEGLSMIVYADGVYQCNRNRIHLRQPKRGQNINRTEVDFRVRQKEQKIENNLFIGRQWQFDHCNMGKTGPANVFHDLTSY